MAEETIQAGDVVELKSGEGPRMTVVGPAPGGLGLTCQWFDAKTELKTGTFKPHVLKKIE